MINTLHNALLDVDAHTLKALETWASDECDSDRYNRQAVATRAQKEYHNGRLAVHNLLLAETRTLLVEKGENIYIKKKRGAESTSE